MARLFLAVQDRPSRLSQATAADSGDKLDMKISVCIEYDTETRTATVAVGSNHPQVWTDCDLSVLKDIQDRVDTMRRTVSLEGLAP
jgi:hypothetical protein